MKQSVSNRAATAVLRALTGALWGAPPLLIEEIVEHLGPGAALKWFATNLPEYERIMKEWGPIRTHLLCVEASLLNGCSYCTHAHAYAFELYYFRDKLSLFPLDEHAIIALRDRGDDGLRADLRDALLKSAIPEEAEYFEKLWEQRFSTKEPATVTERRIHHILQMFEMLNFCAIDAQVSFDHAHDPINKDEALKLRYAEARLAVH